MAAMLDQFAKRLAVAVDVLEQFIARRAPPGEPPFERMYPRIAQLRQRRRARLDESFAIVIKYDRHILAGQPRHL